VNLTFVVSTGRAGPTLVSRMLPEHPDVLSVSEFFAALTGTPRRQPCPSHDMDGRELWQLLARPDRLADALAEKGLQTPEMLYPYGRGRFSPPAGIPATLAPEKLAALRTECEPGEAALDGQARLLAAHA
jgi:hypothetical protein